ncbi:MAG: hypothetical protein HOP08_14075 [Cyclobacteriaceae bacterium]|nr:hypothetical protein [Cyclobacteriaceae bacterium]
MKTLTEQMLSITLVTLIKGVALAGLITEVLKFYAREKADKIFSALRRNSKSIGAH